MTLGSRIAVMKDGVLQQDRHADEISPHTRANAYVAGFIGSPTMNFQSPGRTWEGAGASPAVPA